MKKKSELLKEVVLMISAPKIQKWYNENLETNPQAETIDSLEKGVLTKQITIREALALSLLVGVQWNEKFDNTP